jgi:hypothetical protein
VLINFLFLVVDRLAVAVEAEIHLGMFGRCETEEEVAAVHFFLEHAVFFQKLFL